MSTERPLPERAIRPNALRIQPQRKAAPPTKRAQELLNSRNSQINSSPTTPRLSGLAARRAGNKLHLNDLDDITTRKLGGGVEGAGLGAGRPRRAPPTNAFQDFSNIVCVSAYFCHPLAMLMIQENLPAIHPVLCVSQARQFCTPRE